MDNFIEITESLHGIASTATAIAQANFGDDLERLATAVGDLADIVLALAREIDGHD
jgi:hypothetical protein